MVTDVLSHKVIFRAEGYNDASRALAHLAPDILMTFNFTDDDRCWMQLYHHGDRVESVADLDAILSRAIPPRLEPEWHPAHWYPEN